MKLGRRLIFRILVAILIAIASTVSIMAADGFSGAAQRLLDECEKSISTRQYAIAAEKGAELARLGNSEGNSTEATVGDALRLHSLIAVRDTTDFTADIEALIKKSPSFKESDPKSYAIVTRTISSYYQRILNDYSQALLYATETLNAVRQIGDKNMESAALSVLASIYFQKQDPAGWSYALDSYNLAKEHGDYYSKYVAACNLANYLYNKSDSEGAMRHLLEAKEYASKVKLTSEESYLNSFLGDVYWHMGKMKEAEQYYRQSLDFTPAISNYDKVYSSICYAIFLVENKRYADGLTALFNSLDMAGEYHVSIFDKEIYSWLSRAYEEMGNLPKSLEYYKKYTAAQLALISEQKEREFAILDLRNRVTEEERKNASQALELAKRGKTIVILISVGGLFLLICVGGFIYHRRKVRDYEEVVKRYLDNAKSEQLLRQQLEEALQSKQASKTSGLDDEKQTELYMHLDKLMREDKIYRNSSLSLSSTAEMLSTNRTYLSQVVNEKSGKSFSSYVNECRLNEAVALLSDSDNETPLKEIGSKVGFTSSSNFYTLFKQRVGVSPSVFRENVKKIAAEHQNQQNDIQN
ncbi:MAG: helix-turn-helix domain-containing protein [Muribaculum sp.]|nr:helix-turn-helix domain-containing protein [Muribaculum sp.]